MFQMWELSSDLVSRKVPVSSEENSKRGARKIQKSKTALFMRESHFHLAKCQPSSEDHILDLAPDCDLYTDPEKLINALNLQ